MSNLLVLFSPLLVVTSFPPKCLSLIKIKLEGGDEKEEGEDADDEEDGVSGDADNDISEGRKFPKGSPEETLLSN